MTEATIYQTPNSELGDKDLESLPYAGFWIRALSHIIDMLLLALVIVPLLLYMLGFENLMDPNSSFGVVGFVLNYVFPFTVVILFWHYKSATPGKMILNLKIVDVNTGHKPSLAQFVIRYFSYLVSTIPFGLGYLWVAWDERKQAFHDKLAKTAVVKGRN